MEWISVKERTPEVKNKGEKLHPDLKTSVPVLAINDDGEMLVARYEVDTDEETGEVYTYWNYNDNSDVTHGITHWMPLPDPPKND